MGFSRTWRVQWQAGDILLLEDTDNIGHFENEKRLNDEDATKQNTWHKEMGEIEE